MFYMHFCKREWSNEWSGHLLELYNCKTAETSSLLSLILLINSTHLIRSVHL